MMKVYIFLTVILMTFLWATWAKEDVEAYINTIIPPRSMIYQEPYGGLRHYPALRPKSRRHRSMRHSKVLTTCRVPPSLNTAELNCKLYPYRVACVQTCKFGYTLSDGIRRIMNCSHLENKWLPTAFEECEPFVDCTVTLGPGGDLKCTTDFMDKGTICEISCKAFEDKKAVPKATYQCNVDGKWSPKLPFCASAGTGQILVSPPKGAKVLKDLKG